MAWNVLIAIKLVFDLNTFLQLQTSFDDVLIDQDMFIT